MIQLTLYTVIKLNLVLIMNQKKISTLQLFWFCWWLHFSRIKLRVNKCQYKPSENKWVLTSNNNLTFPNYEVKGKNSDFYCSKCVDGEISEDGIKFNKFSFILGEITRVESG